MTADATHPPFTAIELDYLAGQRLGRLATAAPDGTLQVSPVGFAYNADTGTIDIGGYTMAASRKFRNVAANGRVAFVVDDIASVQPWRVRCLEIRGRGEAIVEPTDTANGPVGPIIRIHPVRIISFGIGDLDTEPHDLVPDSRTVT
ncbi:PPOX class F420-dependent oxidoreductase [Tsukamurella soli]